MVEKQTILARVMTNLPRSNMKKLAITLVAIAIVAACNQPKPPKTTKAAEGGIEVAIYPKLSQLYESRENPDKAALASWDLLHPSSPQKTKNSSERAKDEYIKTYIRNLNEGPAFSYRYCDNPTFTIKSPARIENNYAFIDVDINCGKMLMRSFTETVINEHGQWYWVHRQIKSTYIDKDSPKLKASAT